MSKTVTISGLSPGVSGNGISIQIRYDQDEASQPDESGTTPDPSEWLNIKIDLGSFEVSARENSTPEPRTAKIIVETSDGAAKSMDIFQDCTTTTTTTEEPAPTVFNINAYGSEGISSVSGGGTYGLFAACTLSCILEEGYSFDGWYDANANVKVSESQTYRFTVTESKVLTARAIPDTTEEPTTTQEPTTQEPTTTEEPTTQAPIYK
jgi:hypothetical protein